MTWALMLATLRGRELPPLPAIAGRVHVLADEPLPDFLLDELLAEGAAPSTVAAQARVPIAVARTWLAAGRRLPLLQETPNDRRQAKEHAGGVVASGGETPVDAPESEASADGQRHTETTFATSTRAHAQEGGADQAPGVSCRRNARARARGCDGTPDARNPAREGVHLTTRAD